MKIRLMFKQIYSLGGKLADSVEIEASSWSIDDQRLILYRKPEKQEDSFQAAVYDIGCVLGFEVVST
jgi:hypothetical protein